MFKQITRCLEPVQIFSKTEEVSLEQTGNWRLLNYLNKPDQKDK